MYLHKQKLKLPIYSNILMSLELDLHLSPILSQVISFIKNINSKTVCLSDNVNSKSEKKGKTGKVRSHTRLPLLWAH